jgi:hypothetical protein
MRALLVATALLAAPPVSSASQPRAMAREEVPTALRPALARGEAAMDALRDRLFARLNALLVEGGPVHAIQVCRSDAPAIAKEIREAHGVQIGRTSHRLRNAANAPPGWARAYVEAAAGRKADDVKLAVFDLGGRVGVLRPLAVMPACTRCHGPVEGIDGDVRAELARAYPADRATQFVPGDLRGFVWVEVPKR